MEASDAQSHAGATSPPETDVVPVYSIVVPIHNEEAILPQLYERVRAVMARLDGAAELVLVNDGSTDTSYRIMRALHRRDPRVRVIDFSRNFGHQLAISAGMAYARGRAVVIMDGDLQDPPEVIPALIAKWRAGADVVYAQRVSRKGETRFKLLTARLFYRLIRRLTAVDIPPDTGDFRLLDRRVVNTLVQLREHHRFMRGLSAWVGYEQVAVPYERQERAAGVTKYPLRKMVRFALDAITGFSYVPLQLATTFGFVLAGLSLLGILIAIGIRLFTNQIVGQASTLILVLFLGGIQLIFLGIIGEYLGRIYDEVRARPLYIVREVLEGSAEEDDRTVRAADGRTDGHPATDGRSLSDSLDGLPQANPESFPSTPARP
jgi:dolichol-phosphate mannosyltransferase